MCDTCGCSQADDAVTIRLPGDQQNHHDHTHGHHDHTHGHHDHTHGHHDHTHGHHDHTHGHHDLAQGHSHAPSGARSISVETDILQKNNLLAERNRGYLDAKSMVAINLVSSPGSGKTSLLEYSIRALSGELPIAVIEGDQQTMNDANRILKAGAPVVQINTGNGCHLDADMVQRAIKTLAPADGSLLMIENVGNLVCPSLFDLGETRRVVIMSVTEGEDKPQKYPNMFRGSQLCIINKIDLLPYLDYDIDAARRYIQQINHHMEVIELSVKSGEGVDRWLAWLRALVPPKRSE